MPDPVDHLQTVGDLVRDLRALGLAPVLVGGMALVVLGSRRVTRDFDFVIAHPGDRLARTIDLFYDRGLELASRLNHAGDVIATITDRNVAALRLRLDAPASAYFFNAETGLRVDLLFDFPIPAATLAEHATRITIRTLVFDVASEPDLLRLKTIAQRRGRRRVTPRTLPFSRDAGKAPGKVPVAPGLSTLLHQLGQFVFHRLAPDVVASGLRVQIVRPERVRRERRPCRRETSRRCRSRRRSAGRPGGR